jgi:hypothetical protein
MTSHVDEKPTPPMIGRRAIARGAAWSVPVVALAVAAPASAATSGGGGSCTPTAGSLLWRNQSLPRRAKNLFGTALQTSIAGVTLTVTASGDTGATNNGVPSSGPIGGATSLLLLHSENYVTNTTQTVTLTFSKPVQNLQLSLLDIDSSATTDRRGRVTTHWEDVLSVTPTPSSQAKGAGVQGTGTSAAPWRAINNNNVVSDNQTTGNVALSWAGPLTSVTIVYRQDGAQDGSPKVGIGDLSFRTVCP